MNVNITYPLITKKRQHKEQFIRFMGVLLIVGCIICILLNVLLKGKPWSLIASIGAYIFWRFILSPSLVERNRIDSFVRLLTIVCFLLHMIDIYFVRGWAIFVVPIVLFSGLIACSVLLFTDYETQKNNIFPVYLILIFSLVISLFGIHSDQVTRKWVYIVLFGVSLFYLIVCTFIVKNNILKEFRKRLSMK